MKFRSFSEFVCIRSAPFFRTRLNYKNGEGKGQVGNKVSIFSKQKMGGERDKSHRYSEYHIDFCHVACGDCGKCNYKKNTA